MTRNVAMIVGSLRKGSFTRMVANALAELAPRSLDLDHAEIGDLPLYNQDFDDEKRPPEQWKRFRDRIRNDAAVLFLTPEYNRSMPGVLKNAIDVGSRPYGSSVWAGKPAAIVSCSPGAMGGFGANHHLRQSLVFLDMPALQQPEMYLNNVNKAFDKDGKLTDDKVRELLTKFITKFEAWVDKYVEYVSPVEKKSA
ncbi:MAG TPA: NAD(P)H-dependent oxidoreductase [Kofleriaceae bacterium]|jgi:chromate reductase|nr:NAD(P)H-dependent oxidoreductase [Kofleriaceae bacterium]